MGTRKKEEVVWQDIQGAKKKVVLALPDGMKLGQGYIEVLEKLKRGISVIVLSTTAVPGIGYLIPEDLPFPFIIVDDEYLWLGQPFECAKGSRPPYVAIRLHSPAFIMQFLAHLPVDGTLID